MKTPASREFGDLISKALSAVVLKKEEPPKSKPAQSEPTPVVKHEEPAPTTAGDLFPIDGRSDEEVKEMREYGYVEDPEYRKPGVARADGYFCSTCKAFDARPNTMSLAAGPDDGFCKMYEFRDRSFGCCDSWTKR